MSDLGYAIMSCGRADSIISHKLFPWADIYVPEFEQDEYEESLDRDVKTYPESKHGYISKVRNYVMYELFQDHDGAVIIDDDIVRMRSICGEKNTQINDPDVVRDRIENVAIKARDMDVRLFGMNTEQRPLAYKPWQPFRFNSPVDVVVGIWRKKPIIEFDEQLPFYADYDFCLQCLLHDRVVFKDCRYAWQQKSKDQMKGGANSLKTDDRKQENRDYLKEKWGKHLSFIERKSTVATRINVSRQQTLVT